MVITIINKLICVISFAKFQLTNQLHGRLIIKGRSVYIRGNGHAQVSKRNAIGSQVRW